MPKIVAIPADWFFCYNHRGSVYNHFRNNALALASTVL